MSELSDRLRNEFEALRTKREAIVAKSGPLRQARDAFVNEAREKENAMNREIKEVETGLYDLDMDIGRLARALGGRTMSQGQTTR